MNLVEVILPVIPEIKIIYIIIHYSPVIERAVKISRLYSY